MLYTKTVEPETLDLLIKIQSIPEFSTFRLVGGTALALQYGHRKSIDDELLVGDIKMATTKDIAAMKLAAITNRGSKKDFIDLNLLFQTYSLKEMLNFYTTKYPDGSEFQVLKSLIYFEEADDEEALYHIIPINAL